MIRKVYKSLSKNELGLTGSHQDGILVPKELARDDFFPFLDPSLPNPRTKIQMKSSNSVEEFTYVYYNSKKLGNGTRDEYRITGLSKFYREYKCKPGDRVCIVHDDNKNHYEIYVVNENVSSDEDQLQKPLVIRAGWAF